MVAVPIGHGTVLQVGQFDVLVGVSGPEVEAVGQGPATQLVSAMVPDVVVAEARPVLVPGQLPVDGLVFVEKVFVQVPVEDGVADGVGRAQQLEDPVYDARVPAQGILAGDVAVKERDAELRGQGHEVERKPAEEKDASHGDDDVVGAPTPDVGVLVLRRRPSTQPVNNREIDVHLQHMRGGG